MFWVKNCTLAVSGLGPFFSKQQSRQRGEGGKKILLPFLRERLQRFRVDESKSTDRQNGQSTGAENTTDVHEL